MGVIDVLCILFIFAWFLLGLRRGIVCEILCLLVLAVGFLVAYFVHPTLTDVAGRFLTYNDNTDRIIFLVSFIIVLLIIQMLTNRIIATIGAVDNPPLLSKLLGGVIAAGRAVIYAGVFLWLTSSFFPGSSPAKQISRGIVTSTIEEGFGVVYNSMDRLIRKNHISPFKLEKYIE